MRLLVSVRDAGEAAAALAGGADIIDAKEPLAGALGPVAHHVFREICAAVGSTRPVSAALGDAVDAHAAVVQTFRSAVNNSIEEAARDFAVAGATFVKIGFQNDTRMESLLRAAVQGANATACGVIGVVYADSNVDSRVALQAIRRAGAAGMLLDTADKQGPGLRQLMTPSMLARLVADAHDAGLLVAVAGQLTADDLPFARDAGADIAGVRGAACDKERTSRVSADKVRMLHAVCATEPVRL